MLWYKSWRDTRWRFFVALGVLTLSGTGVVLIYPRVLALVPLVPASDAGGELGRRIREIAQLSREFRGYLWAQWFHQNVRQEWTVVSALLGTGGLVAQGSTGALFTLSLPVSRNQLVAVRAAAGLAELLLVALTVSLLLPIVAPAVGQRYAVADAVAHAICMFAAGAVFFSLACLLSTSFDDPWPTRCGNRSSRRRAAKASASGRSPGAMSCATARFRSSPDSSAPRATAARRRSAGTDPTTPPPSSAQRSVRR